MKRISQVLTVWQVPTPGFYTQIYHEISVIFFPINISSSQSFGENLRRAENCKILVFAEQKHIYSLLFSFFFLLLFSPSPWGKGAGKSGRGRVVVVQCL